MEGFEQGSDVIQLSFNSPLWPPCREQAAGTRVKQDTRAEVTVVGQAKRRWRLGSQGGGWRWEKRLILGAS